jgi:hypothetical protein
VNVLDGLGILGIGTLTTLTVYGLLRLLAPHSGQHAGRLATASPVASPDFYGSMTRDDELAWFRELAEPEPAWLEDDRAWHRQFAGLHPAPVVEAAVDQRGGWTSGECWPPYDSGDGGMVATWPPPEIPPRPDGSWASVAPGPGWADVTGPDGANESPLGSTAEPGPVTLTVVPEIAHDEYAGPAANSPIESPAAGPVPHTPEDIALAAQVRAWASQMDADTLNYLHDYKERLAA